MKNETAQTTVMVVDDTPANLRYLQEILRDKGNRVMAFPDGKAALNAVAKRPPDMIVLDILMPEMDGFEVCRRLKADPYLSKIPVLFISALGDVDHKTRAFEEGGVDYVTKPFPTSGEQTLDRAIEGAVAKQGDSLWGHLPEPAEKGRRFWGGRMVFFEDRVELCGVKILGNTGMGYSRTMLELLARRRPDGRFVTMTGSQLAEQVAPYLADGQITGFASTIRSNVEHELLNHLGIEVKRDDVLVNDAQGYHLNERITVERRDTSPDVPDMAPDVTAVSPCHGPGLSPVTPEFNERQEWILAELRKGTQLRRRMVEERFRVSGRTAKRDFAALRKQGLIAYVRSPSPGHYVLRERQG